MTFFNKKTEVMNVEMTPYGRYLYSIGKFKPHSYEFVDDDVLYKAAGSSETQEAAHNRILNETPKIKPIRHFETTSTEEIPSPARIEQQRIVIEKMDLRNPSIFSLGKSSYSSSKSPSIQVTMLKGAISSSTVVSEVDAVNEHAVRSQGGDIHIPQVNIEFNLISQVLNQLEVSNLSRDFASKVFDDGTYVDLTYDPLMIHLKEFGSFYEKENFELEIFEVEENDQLRKLKLQDVFKPIENDILMQDGDLEQYIPGDLFFEEDSPTPDFVDYFFTLSADNQIPTAELCEVSEHLRVNDQFLDEELDCPDQRTDRFDIYRTRVTPSDLEDCDD